VEPEIKKDSDPIYHQSQIALTSGQNDSGLFEMNHHDERYLPFELQGVESTWKLEFPSQFASFDHSTISDVVLHMRYTAVANHDLAKTVNDRIVETYNTFRKMDHDTPNQPAGMAQRLDIRRDSPNHWHQFTSSSDNDREQEFTLQLSKDSFPYMIRPFSITITHVTLTGQRSERLQETMKFSINGTPLTVDSVQLKESSGSIWIEPVTTDLTVRIPDNLTQMNLTVRVSQRDGQVSKTAEIDKLTELIIFLHYTIKQTR